MFKLVSEKKWRNSSHFVSLVSAVLLFLLVAFFGYKFYMKRYENSAHKDLANTIDEFYKKLSTGSINDQGWQDIERAFAAGSKKYSRSNLLPYFLAFQADAAVAQNKLKEAIDLMSSSVSYLDKKNPLYYAYSIKLSLMKLDSQDLEQNKQATIELEKLSADKLNPLKEMAQYYLAQDYENNNEKEKASNILTQLINTGDKNSYWYQMASQKLGS